MDRVRESERIAEVVLGQARERGTLRRLREFQSAPGPFCELDGRELLMFASNNYLDLASHPEVVEAAAHGARGWGAAAGGSCLIVGNMTCHRELEQELAAFCGTEAALVFASGYALNMGLIPALLGYAGRKVQPAGRKSEANPSEANDQVEPTGSGSGSGSGSGVGRTSFRV